MKEMDQMTLYRKISEAVKWRDRAANRKPASPSLSRESCVQNNCTDAAKSKKVPLRDAEEGKNDNRQNYHTMLPACIKFLSEWILPSQTKLPSAAKGNVEIHQAIRHSAVTPLPKQ
jgi:hypothetical protein